MMKQTQPPAPGVVGDPRGFVGVRLETSAPNTRVALIVTIDEIADPSPLEVTLERPGEYRLKPRIKYRYKALTNAIQPMTVNVNFSVSVNGAAPQTAHKVARVRSVNDVPFAWKSDTGNVTVNNWTFAAFVNEEHPWIDPLLREALNTRRVGQFTGYQTGRPEDVYRQVEAVWLALKRRGIRYSSITTTSSESDRVYSQHVRFLSDSVGNAQANCIDGTVLFASVLRKIDIDPVIVFVPGHAFLGFYLDRGRNNMGFLETTMLGTSDFRSAVATGRENYQRHRVSPRTQLVDVERARKLGITPISR